MNFLDNYGSDDESPTSSIGLTNARVLTNPIVSSTALSTSLLQNSSKAGLITADMMVLTNPKMEILCAPVEGPKHPFKQSVAATSSRKIGMGFIEDTVIDATTFDDQYKSYLKSGYAVDSATNNIIGDYNSYLNDLQPPQKKSKSEERANKRIQQMKNIMQSVLDEEQEGNNGGVWAATANTHADAVMKLLEENKTLSESLVAESKMTEESEKEEQEVCVPTEPVNSTYHIIEPDEAEEMWERINERKNTFNTLPIRPARGSTAVEVSV